LVVKFFCFHFLKTYCQCRMVCNLQMRAAVCEVANCFPTAIVSGRSKDKVIHSLNKILHYVDIRYHPSFFEVVLFSFCFQTCIFNAYLYFSFFFFFLSWVRDYGCLSTHWIRNYYSRCVTAADQRKFYTH